MQNRSVLWDCHLYSIDVFTNVIGREFNLVVSINKMRSWAYEITFIWMSRMCYDLWSYEKPRDIYESAISKLKFQQIWWYHNLSRTRDDGIKFKDYSGVSIYYSAGKAFLNYISRHVKSLKSHIAKLHAPLIYLPICNCPNFFCKSTLLHVLLALFWRGARCCSIYFKKALSALL